MRDILRFVARVVAYAARFLPDWLGMEFSGRK